MRIDIKTINGKVIFSHDCENNSIKKTVEEAIKEGVNLSEANLSEANLSEANLSQADLTWADLSGTNLSKSNLSGANFCGADFCGTNLTWANLSGADFCRANFCRADLSGANLSEADFCGADLSKSNLSKANLAWTDLSETNFCRANLSGANLSGADLRGASLSEANLSGVLLTNIPIPVIKDIHRKIYDAIMAEGNSLKMASWHTCETTHCRAGWVIHLTGKEGYALEEKYGSSVAGALIYQASDPAMKKIPDWHASNEDAMTDIRKLAGVN